MHRIAVLAGVGLSVLAAFAGSATRSISGSTTWRLAPAPCRGALPRPAREIPGWLMEIDYDSWREIRFRSEASLWRGGRLPSRSILPSGFLYDRRVA